MKYDIQFKPKAVKDLKRMHRQEATRILDALQKLTIDFSGDVKKLTELYP